MLPLDKPKPRSFFSKIKKGLNDIEVKIAIKTGLAATLSWMAGLGVSKFMERPDPFVSGLWSVLTAIVVMQAHLGGTYQAAWNRFLGMFLGSVVGAFTTYYAGSNFTSLGLSIFCTVILCSVLRIKESFRIACMSTAVIVILSGMHPQISPWLFSSFRFMDACVGILIAVFVAHALWPEKAIENLRTNIAKTLSLLSRFYRSTIDLDAPGDKTTPISQALYKEIADTIEETHSYREDTKLELLNKEVQRDEWILITEHLEEIFELISVVKILPKDVLAQIFDDNLAKSFSLLVDQTDLSFQTLEKMMSDQKIIPPPSNDDLPKALTNLNAELLRFRGTRTTRKFKLEDVESFYVFFYNLRAIAVVLRKIEGHVRNLLEHN